MIKRLHDILHRAGVSQSEIKNGVRLSDRGYQKIAGALGVGVDEVRQLLNKLRDEHSRLDGYTIAQEASVRFGYENDILGNVQINDLESGQTKMISGSDGQSLISRLSHVPDGGKEEQEILSSYFGILNEKEIAEIEPAPESFEKEIHNEAGTFNFPWKTGGRHGTATANYSGTGGQFRLSIVSIRDEDGTEINMDALYDRVRTQAIEFIGRE